MKTTLFGGKKISFGKYKYVSDLRAAKAYPKITSFVQHLKSYNWKWRIDHELSFTLSGQSFCWCSHFELKSTEASFSGSGQLILLTHVGSSSCNSSCSASKRIFQPNKIANRLVRYKTIERKLKSHSLRLFDFPKLIYPSLHAFSEKKNHIDPMLMLMLLLLLLLLQLPTRCNNFQSSQFFHFAMADFIDRLAKKFATKKMKLPNVRDSNLPLVCDAHGRVESTWKQQQLNLFSLAGLTFGNAKKSLNR